MWQWQRRELAALGRRVVAPDLPGAGGGRSFRAWAERTLALVDGPVVPVGISMGGYLAFELWRRASERIAALVLADTRAGQETPEGRKGRDETIRLVREGGATALWASLEERLFAPAAPAPAVDLARRIALEQPVSGLVAALEAIRDREDSRPALRSIAVPTLVVVGEEDMLTPPSEAEAIVHALPGARLVRVARSGHLPPLERPDEFNAALTSFLEEQEA